MRHSRATICMLLLLFAAVPHAQRIDIGKPGPRDFVIEYAGLISPEDERYIQRKAESLFDEAWIPIVIVTIPSMASVSSRFDQIEPFATALFNQWGIGYEEVNGVSWNRGVLFVISKGDRKARIELGADWGREFNGTCRQIMDGIIVPQFKRGDYSSGIRAGFDALDLMSRGIPVPNLGKRVQRAQSRGAVQDFIDGIPIEMRLLGVGLFMGAILVLWLTNDRRARRHGRHYCYDDGSWHIAYDSGYSGGGGATGSWDHSGSSGSSDSGGGGGGSSGGGSSGGGGASGSW